jgi:chromosomal replication initiator protein
VPSASRESPESAWRAIQTRVAAHVPATDLTEILRPLRPVALTGTELRLEAPNKLVLALVTEHYMPVLRQAAGDVIGERQLLVDVAAPREQGELFPEVARARAEPRAAAPRATLNPRLTFKSFVVGASNQFAHAACSAVARQPGTHYNPLFIYGGSGLGKTHLVSAIGHAVQSRDPGLHVEYLSCDTFMTELVSSLRRDRMEQFKDRFRHVDLLIVDDVQLLAGRERTQEEFFHTFNTLHERRRQIVLTSDKVPKDIPELEERLRSRFEWGLIADIQPPDIETRLAILQRKAELERIPLPADVALFLAEQASANVRELEGWLTRIGAHASLHRREITLDYVRDILQLLGAERPPAVTFDAIAAAVCAHFAVRLEELQSRRRSRHIAGPRQVAMYLCRRLMQASLPRIGDLFQRDHTTVLHAIAQTEERLRTDIQLQADVEQLERSLRRATAA